MNTTADDVVAFWREAGYDNWFQGSEAFDARCRERFAHAHDAAARRELESWMGSDEGALALVLLLDQIPRNIFRGSAHAFATDPLARHYAGRAVAERRDRSFEPALRGFFYLPWEHAEAMDDQDRSVALFTALGDPTYLRYAHAHRDVIARFGRFPHRNHVLGRESTPQERAWLEAGGGF